jgi:hypothetical protein
MAGPMQRTGTVSIRLGAGAAVGNHRGEPKDEALVDSSPFSR